MANLRNAVVGIDAILSLIFHFFQPLLLALGVRSECTNYSWYYLYLLVQLFFCRQFFLIYCKQLDAVYVNKVINIILWISKYVASYAFPNYVKSKFGDSSRGWHEGSLFDSFYTKV